MGYCIVPWLIAPRSAAFKKRHLSCLAASIYKFAAAQRECQPWRGAHFVLTGVREVSSHAVQSSEPRLTSSRLARRSHTVQSQGSYHHTKGRASSAINAHLCERENVHSRRCQVTLALCLHQRRSRGMS